MNIPELPKYEKDIERLEKVYKKAFNDIVKQLKDVDPNDLIKIELYESQLRQITFIVNELTQESREWFEDKLLVAYSDSYASSLVTMGLADNLIEARGDMDFSLMARERIEATINDTFQDVLKAHSIMEGNLKNRVREVQAEVLREQFARGEVSTSAGRVLRSKFLEEGFSKNLLEEEWKGITDAGGKRWDLTTYTKMVAKTKFQQAQIEGARQVALENDSDLALISSHGASDSCRFFEGLIVSLEGKTKGYKTLAEVRGSGLIFHPNCQHSVHTIGNIDLLPKAVKDKAYRADTRSRKAMEQKDRLMKEDNQRRYKDKKDRLEMSRQARRNNLAIAREKKRIGRTKSSMVGKPEVFNRDNTNLAILHKKSLYEGTPLIELADKAKGRDAEAIKAMFGDKITHEGLANSWNPDPSKYDIHFHKNKFRTHAPGMHSADLEMLLKDKKGNTVGTINRMLVKRPDGSLYVKNSYFEIDKAYQGAGFARDVYFKSEQLFREMQKGKPIEIGLSANLDVGVYAWARHGFDFKKPEDVLELRGYIEEKLKKEIRDEYKAGKHGDNKSNGRIAEIYKQKLNKLGYNSLDEIKHSWQFAALDDGKKYKLHTNNTEGHYGKHLMLSLMEWEGVKKLNIGHDSEIIGDLYFKSKGVK